LSDNKAAVTRHHASTSSHSSRVADWSGGCDGAGDAIMLTSTTKEQYSIWGWRIPFFRGAALAFGFLYYYYQTVPESELWMACIKSRPPLKELMTGPHRRNLLQVMIMMLGFWFASQTVIGVMPGMLIQQLE
jgi:hypothetical protein